MTKSRSRRQMPIARVMERFETSSFQDSGRNPIAVDDVGLPRSAFYRWRQTRSEPPPPLFEPPDVDEAEADEADEDETDEDRGRASGVRRKR